MTLQFYSCCRDVEGNFIQVCGCECPEGELVCVSEERVAALCGYNEFINPSSPPKTYLRRTHNNSISLYDPCSENCNAPERRISAILFRQYTISSADCSETDTGQDSYFVENYDCTLNPCGSSLESSVLTFSDVPNAPLPNAISSTELFWDSGLNAGLREIRRTTLSIEDTEDNAIARAEITEGESCSSLWEVRDIAFTFVKRTVSYSINLINLADGQDYRVRPVIRKRTAVVGDVGEWEDVSVDWESFTASGDTQTIGPVDLPHVQGWEYEITNFDVEPEAPSGV